MTAQPSEADVIFNRANVALAKSQRLVASWLPPPTNSELKNAKTEEQIENEEQEMFTPVPELLGLGAKPPEDLREWDLKRQKLSSNDELRRKLLGKDYAKLRGTNGHDRMQHRDAGYPLAVGSKPRPPPVKRGLEGDSSDEEDGRASLGRKKVKKPAEVIETNSDDEIEAEAKDTKEFRSGRQEPLKNSRRANNYLDEVLSQKKEKKYKSKRKKAKGDKQT
ncbi:MAG: hypothetical protein Q9204_003332 [Flavoplaca sp. TL-2023a]